MAKYEAKTKQESTSVAGFLNAIEDAQVKADCKALVKLMKEVSGFEPAMWGGSIVGFGKYHYKYESGHEGDSCLTGFSPRKGNISIYTNIYLEDNSPLMKKLGKFKNGKSCIYIKKMADIDPSILAKIIDKGIKGLQLKYPAS
ncbi:MAG: DUF1801 domain-containing protein [Sphingobacteriales bacterium]|nr:MAG: DUF1801 domain-containing protein [Sphingobacteriales bacterium]